MVCHWGAFAETTDDIFQGGQPLMSTPQHPNPSAHELSELSEVKPWLMQRRYLIRGSLQSPQSAGDLK